MISSSGPLSRIGSFLFCRYTTSSWVVLTTLPGCRILVVLVVLSHRVSHLPTRRHLEPYFSCCCSAPPWFGATHHHLHHDHYSAPFFYCISLKASFGSASCCETINSCMLIFPRLCFVFRKWYCKTVMLWCGCFSGSCMLEIAETLKLHFEKHICKRKHINHQMENTRISGELISGESWRNTTKQVRKQSCTTQIRGFCSHFFVAAHETKWTHMNPSPLGGCLRPKNEK